MGLTLFRVTEALPFKGVLKTTKATPKAILRKTWFPLSPGLFLVNEKNYPFLEAAKLSRSSGHHEGCEKKARAPAHGSVQTTSRHALLLQSGHSHSPEEIWFKYSHSQHMHDDGDFRRWRHSSRK